MPEQAAESVPATDRAFLYGDGVFETLLIVNGIALWPELHLDRMIRGAQRLGIDLSSSAVHAAIAEAQTHYQHSAGVLRITVSRNGGGRGYAPSKGVGGRVTAAHSDLGREPFQALPSAVVVTSSIIMGEQPLLAGLKHCNRLEQVMAAAEALDRNVDDVLLCRSDAAYQCSSNANIFLLSGDTLLTPGCDRSGVSGTRRRFILEKLSAQQGLSAVEATLTVSDLQSADAMFICNSIMGIRNVARCDELEFEPSAVLERLQQAYYQEARQCCAM
ncbi:MAG: 4-amino-4-deoxychorismate lyase [Glaciecola sp.]|jgi:4-amino-4-deoxychorismate lyase